MHADARLPEVHHQLVAVLLLRVLLLTGTQARRALPVSAAYGPQSAATDRPVLTSAVLTGSARATGRGAERARGLVIAQVWVQRGVDVRAHRRPRGSG